MKLDAYWMPFTANRQFKKAPRLLARSSGMHYWTDDGRQILDGVAGLWCVNAGHAVQHIAAFGRLVEHALGLGQQARRLLELPVGGEGHPVGVEFGGAHTALSKVVGRPDSVFRPAAKV